MANITKVSPQGITKRDLLDNLLLTLSYLYGELDERILRTLDEVIRQDEELSLFYGDLRQYRLETGAPKQQMQSLLEEMQFYRSKFAQATSGLGPLAKGLAQDTRRPAGG